MPPRDETPGRQSSVFALDVRSLAAFRVAMGIVLLADLATRASDFQVMYGPDGLAPVDLVWNRLGPGEWSLHLLRSSLAWQAVLFSAAAVLSVMLTVGYYTRLATFGCWLLTTSLHARLPIVLNAGDDLLRALLFWSLFLPLGATWSLDSRRRVPSSSKSVASLGTVALTCQLALVYWCAGLTKMNAAWLGGGALEQVLSLGHYARFAGEWIRQFPSAVRLLNWSVFALELAGPCLLFIPWKSARLRTIAVVAFIAFHLGIAATIHVGVFAWIGAAAWLAMIPSAAWDRLMRTESSTHPDVDRADLAAQPIVALTPPTRFLAIAALAFVVVWNGLDVLALTRTPIAAAAIRPVLNATGLRQSWRLFSTPPRLEAWFVYQGRLKNGARVDLLRGVPLDQGDMFSESGQQFDNHRWRKLHVRLAQDRYAAYRQPLADAAFRSWNVRHGSDDQAVKLKLTCIQRCVDESHAIGGLIETTLASVGREPFQGNFDDALREMED